MSLLKKTVLLAFLLTPVFACAQNIPASDASKHFGEEGTVCGRIAEVKITTTVPLEDSPLSIHPHPRCPACATPAMEQDWHIMSIEELVKLMEPEYDSTVHLQSPQTQRRGRSRARMRTVFLI